MKGNLRFNPQPASGRDWQRFTFQNSKTGGNLAGGVGEVVDHRARGGVIGNCTRDSTTSCFIHFIDSKHVNGLAVIWLDFLHEVAIAVIQELCRLSTDCYRY